MYLYSINTSIHAFNNEDKHAIFKPKNVYVLRNSSLYILGFISGIVTIWCLHSIYGLINKCYRYYVDYRYSYSLINRIINRIIVQHDLSEMKRLIDGKSSLEYGRRYVIKVVYPMVEEILMDYDELITKGHFALPSKNRVIDGLITDDTQPLKKYLNLEFETGNCGTYLKFKNDNTDFVENPIRISRHMIWFDLRFQSRFRDDHYEGKRLKNDNKYILFDWFNMLWWGLSYDLLKELQDDSYWYGKIPMNVGEVSGISNELNFSYLTRYCRNIKRYEPSNHWRILLTDISRQHDEEETRLRSVESLDDDSISDVYLQSPTIPVKHHVYRDVNVQHTNRIIPSKDERSVLESITTDNTCNDSFTNHQGSALLDY